MSIRSARGIWTMGGLAIFTAALATGIWAQQPGPGNGRKGPRRPMDLSKLVPPMQETGFKQIFDGKSLEGWDCDPNFWRAEGGAIRDVAMRNRKLVDLLCSLFSAEELRRLARWSWPTVHTALPGATASYAAVAAGLVDALEENGLVDAAFFRALREERPRRAGEIDQVERLWLAPAAPVSSAQTAADRGPTGSGYDVFLAHASPDKPTASRLYEELAAHPGSLRVFLDVRSIELGAAWDLVIPQALRQSRLVVVMAPKR